jgi:hypothetical protein
VIASVGRKYSGRVKQNKNGREYKSTKLRREFEYKISGHYSSSCFYLKHNVSEIDPVSVFK